MQPERRKLGSAKKSVCVLWCAWAALTLALCALSPSAGVALVPLLCVYAYRLSVRPGAWVPAAMAALLCVCGCLVQGASALVFAACVLLASLTVARLCGARLAPLWQAAICAGAGLIAVCALFGIWAAVKGVSVGEAVVSAFADLRLDFVWDAVSKLYYRRQGGVLSPSDELFGAEASAALCEHVRRELEGNLLWYLTGFGAFAGGLGCVGGTAWAKADGELPDVPPVKEWRLGHGYLLAVAAPVLAFAFLAFYEPMRPVVRAAVNVFVTLPGCLGGITLLYHTLCRCKGKAGVAAKIGFWLLLLAAAVFYEWGLLILGFLGLGDAVLNVRKWLDWALEPSENDKKSE